MSINSVNELNLLFDYFEFLSYLFFFRKKLMISEIIDGKGNIFLLSN
jgi:hypothetical protein